MAVGKGKKAVFFIVDAIFGGSIILLGLILASSFYIFEGPSLNINYFADDTLHVMSNLKVGEVNNSYVKSLIADGSITRTNNTILEQIGEFWAERELEKADNLSREFTKGYIDSIYGYGIYADGEQLHLNDLPLERTTIASRKMISGLTKNRTKEGYTARATVSKIDKNITEVFIFNPQGSEAGPGAGGKLRVTKLFNISATDINYAKLTLSIHTGKQLNTQSKFWINGNEIEYSDINWIYDTVNSPESGDTKVSYGETANTEGGDDDGGDDDNVADYLQTGWNNVTIELFGQPGHHTHLHHGTKLLVQYQTSTNKGVEQNNKKRVYFDRTLSMASNKPHGAWQILPFYMPKGAVNKNVTIHVQGKDVYNNPTRNDDIQIYLNDDTLQNGNPPCNKGQRCNVNLTYGINASQISEGTNAVSVYFNSFPDEFWSGNNADSEIYSNPKTDPEGSSYIEFSYDLPDGDKRLKYGKIDVRVAEEFDGRDNYTNFINANLSNLSVLESFVQLATLDTGNITVVSNGYEVFETPFTMATPSTIYIDLDFLQSGVNSVTATDDCSNCSVFWVLNKTLFDYTVYVPSFVGYGKSFDSKQAAIDDAEQRLIAAVGPAVKLVEINDEVLTLSKVPTLWGPAIVEMRVWQ